MIWAIKLLSGARALARNTPWQVWAAIGLLILVLSFGGYCAHRAAQGEKARQAAEQAKTEQRASSSRETASAERLNDTLTIRDRQQERDDDAEALPDAVPDDRELRRRCRQLRESGNDGLPACAGLGG
ncbi:MAG: hypothetical protein ACK4FB_08235 [Brevundimonas sp.]|uniref:hypothetical protein n=1 Tax=Brevundimonas sp. TaxID=1871086 RepID=UPI00391CEE65